MRKYSVDEIDAMRNSLRWHATWANQPKDTAAIEEKLRTNLLAGTSPDELENHARQAQERMLKSRAAEADAERKRQERVAEIRGVVQQELARRKDESGWAHANISDAFAATQKARNSAYRSVLHALFGTHY